jgi:ABC-type branched-subunit amino acid transport system ATPase component
MEETEPGVVASGPMLDVQDLTVRFGAVTAVDHVSLAVPQGSLVGLIGPNGAGKTTFIDAVTGFVPADGSLHLGGTSLHHLAPHRRVAAGLGRTWQSLELFDDLTLRENCLVAAQDDSLTSSLLDLVRPARHAHDPRVDAALELVGLSDAADRAPTELSLGQRKLAGVARALAGAPSLLLLDEPAAGLDTDESAALGERLRRIVAAGTTILLVDHDMGLVLGVCDEVHVLDFGRLVRSGTPDEVRDDPAVIAAYLGTAP